MSLVQTPPGLPLTRRSPGGLACRGQPAGVSLASQGPPRGPPLPPRATCAGSTAGHTPTEARVGGGHHRYIARELAATTSSPGTQSVSVCLGRPGGRLARCGWLGQGFQQRPDLGVGVASVPAQGTEVGQPALLRPATHRLWGHVKELGDLRGTEVPRLGWLWHHALHSGDCPPYGDDPTPIGSERHPAFYTQRASRRMPVRNGWSMTSGR